MRIFYVSRRKKEMIVSIRIDDRLIHGQVATMWSNKLGVTRLMVVNDNVAKND